MRARLLALAIALWPLAVFFFALAPVLFPGAMIADVARLALSGICHQIPARSFEGMALCHRCTGIDAGLALGALFAAFLPEGAIRPASRAAWAISVLPMAIQVPLAWAWPTVDLWWLRLGTGLLLGTWGGASLAVALSGIVASSRRRALVG